MIFFVWGGGGARATPGPPPPPTVATPLSFSQVDRDIFILSQLECGLLGCGDQSL